jgi:hypothetical protein
MNPIEKLMVSRSSYLKLALGVVALVLILLVTGSAGSSLWITPVIILAIWIASQIGLAYRHRATGSVSLPSVVDGLDAELLCSAHADCVFLGGVPPVVPGDVHDVLGCHGGVVE